MIEVLLDTDTLSEVLKGRSPSVKQKMDEYVRHFEQLTFTWLTVMEILIGFRHRGAQQQQERANELFSKNREIIPSAEDFRLAAMIGGDLLRQGRKIGVVDPLIAACALTRGFAIATGNTAHFEFMISAGYPLELQNWR